MAAQRKRSSTGSTSRTKSRSRTGQRSRAKSSNTTSTTGGGLAGLSQARSIGKKLQNYHVKGLELVNEFVAMLPAQTRTSRGRRASTSST